MAEKKHILVVEDEEHLANGIRYNLDAEGYRATIVGDGPSALDVLEQSGGGIDLVILDLMLPGMSGYAVCEWIRSKNRGLPVLILSARTLAEDRTRGFDVGANQYLTKPFDLDEFLSRVRNLLTLHSGRYPQPARDPAEVTVLEFATAKVNFDTFEVTVGGEPVRMTQLEMTLLRYFAENEGRVIPRNELLENVWGLSGNLQTRTPDQFVSRLRKTFESNPAQPKHFLTIRDAGYRFVTEPEED
jgi:two-component system OmpR family response regulator